MPRRPAVLLPPSSWKLTLPICAFCDPLIVVSCSGPPSEFEPLLLLMPPVIDSSVYRSRLTSGRFSTSFWPTVRVSDAELVSTSGASALTETTSWTLPGSIVGVDAGVAADFEQDAGLHEVLESGELDFDLIGADGQQRQRVLAVLVGGGGAGLLGVDVGGGDGGAGDGAAGVVFDVAEDGAGGGLCLDRLRWHQHDAGHGEEREERNGRLARAARTAGPVRHGNVFMFCNLDPRCESACVRSNPDR